MRRRAIVAILGWLLWPVLAAAQGEPSPIVVLEVEGTVEVLSAGGNAWTPARTNQLLRANDQLRTGRAGRVGVRWSNRSIYRFGPRTQIRVPETFKRSNTLNLLRGVLYFFHRDKPGEHPVQTPSAFAVVLGTEFGLEVLDDGTTILALVEGQVDLQTASGNLPLGSGEVARVDPGQAPRRLPILTASNVLQWVFFYPAVLDVEELKFDNQEREVLADSLAAYAAGDLLGALSKYPVDRAATSGREQVYRAALLLSVGEFAEAEQMLTAATAQKGTENLPRLVSALRLLAASVRSETFDRPAWSKGPLTTELLSESYAHQAVHRLDEALRAAREAVLLDPQFALAWARVGELEFAHGHTEAARKAVARSLVLAPRHPAAWTWQGFLLTEDRRYREALEAFDRAIALHGGSGQAWLGRGLLRIRQGNLTAGREDLEVAAALEPQRGFFRSYLGKAHAVSGDSARADQELDRAKKLDPADPTPWLYSALIKQQQNRINAAIRELEISLAKNENRGVYRSRFLLDEDQAVRRANLAAIYQDAGLDEVSVREASRAVTADYANYSAHLFLANSYDALRDPRQVNLRYETPWLSEYLIAHLLAPASAGTLWQRISPYEYSRLFEQDRMGVVSDTEYYSRGDWLQNVSQFGRLGKSSYAVDLAYRSENGHRPNNDLEQLTVSFRFKQDLTPRDSFYLQGIFYDAESGDLTQYYDQSSANPELRIREEQEPLLIAGYHHEWAPGVHSLLLAARLEDTLRVFNPLQETLVLQRDPAGVITDILPITIGQRYRSELDLYSIEGQQIWQGPEHGLTVGLRYQAGEVEARNRDFDAAFAFPFLFPNDAVRRREDLQRVSTYAYHRWQPLPSFLVVAGLSYDRLTAPENFRFAPLGQGDTTRDQWSPKGGLIWTPLAGTTVRAGYSRSLGGVSFDQSFQLEPTQIAGFNQAFRSLIPESVAGASSGERFETFQVSLEQKFGRGTYVGLSGEILQSKVDRDVGAFDFVPFVITPGTTRQELDYQERAVLLTVNQLVGHGWSLGLRYRLSQAQLESAFTEFPATATPAPGFDSDLDLEAVLHQLRLFALYNHSSGFFGELASLWHAQSNHGYAAPQQGDDFWQFDVFVGYRFWHRRVELRAGVLNLTDQDYRLNPLSLTRELPRDRTAVVSLKFSF